MICNECEIVNPDYTEYMGHTFCEECGAIDSLEWETIEDRIEDDWGESLDDLLDEGIDPL